MPKTPDDMSAAAVGKRAAATAIMKKVTAKKQADAAAVPVKPLIAKRSAAKRASRR